MPQPPQLSQFRPLQRRPQETDYLLAESSKRRRFLPQTAPLPAAGIASCNGASIARTVPPHFVAAPNVPRLGQRDEFESVIEQSGKELHRLYMHATDSSQAQSRARAALHPVMASMMRMQQLELPALAFSAFTVCLATIELELKNTASAPAKALNEMIAEELTAGILQPRDGTRAPARPPGLAGLAKAATLEVPALDASFLEHNDQLCAPAPLASREVNTDPGVWQEVGAPRNITEHCARCISEQLGHLSVEASGPRAGSDVCARAGARAVLDRIRGSDARPASRFSKLEPPACENRSCAAPFLVMGPAKDATLDIADPFEQTANLEGQCFTFVKCDLVRTQMCPT